MKNAILLLTVVLIAVPVFAQKEQRFDFTPTKVFNAAVDVARQNYTVESVSDAEKILAFHTGHSLTSNGMYVSVTFDGAPASCEKENSCKKTDVRVRVTKANNQLFAWGAGGRIAKKFFGQLKHQLDSEKP